MSKCFFRECANIDCSYSPKDIQEKGKVFIYDVLYPKFKLISAFDGPGAFSQFGSSLAVGFPFGLTSDPMLAIGAPSSGELIESVSLTHFHKIL